ncbi:hypothetical protein [Aquimarina agarivorans]|uniref:hypothetical protein n=1 Tax=Aquimarina agarivorans TaxID=980584 RepID=UPI000248F5FD|nr:hypothetical protein [Aquimarina agarivorans]
MNPLDSSTAILEIVVLLLISFVLGYVCARIPLTHKKSRPETSNNKNTKKVTEAMDITDPRDIISEPTTIKAVLTRDRKGNAVVPPKQNNSLSTKNTTNN